MTGRKHLRARLITGTRANPATAINDDQATSVPPPDQMLPICPTAASVVGSIPTTGPSAPASEPVSGRPLKPEPSRPAIRPTINTANATMNGFGDKCDCAAVMMSNRKAGPLVPSGNPRMAPEKSPLPMKKNPAIGSTTPIALNANTRPSTTCCDEVSRKLRLSLVADAANSTTAASPPTIAAASPPLRGGTRLVNLPNNRYTMKPRYTNGTSTAKILADNTFGTGFGSSTASWRMIVAVAAASAPTPVAAGATSGNGRPSPPAGASGSSSRGSLRSSIS